MIQACSYSFDTYPLFCSITLVLWFCVLCLCVLVVLRHWQQHISVGSWFFDGDGRISNVPIFFYVCVLCIFVCVFSFLFCFSFIHMLIQFIIELSLKIWYRKRHRKRTMEWGPCINKIIHTLKVCTYEVVFEVL